MGPTYGDSPSATSHTEPVVFPTDPGIGLIPRSEEEEALKVRVRRYPIGTIDAGAVGSKSNHHQLHPDWEERFTLTAPPGQ